MAFDSFVKISDIPGESTDDAHKDWCELLAFSGGLHQPHSSTASSAGGGAAERCEHSPFFIDMSVDKAYPKLAQACAAGTHIAEVLVECCRAGGDKVKYLEIKLEDAVVTNVDISASSHSEGSVPIVRAGFVFGKITWTYTQQKRKDGSPGGNVAAGWDLEANKKA